MSNSGSGSVEDALQDRPVPPQSKGMGFLSQFEGKLASESEVATLRKDREEARQLASRLHVDLDRVAAEADGYKNRAFGAERAASAARDEAKISKLALLQSKQQNDALRAELLRVQQIAADRDAAATDLQSSLAEAKTGLIRAQQEIEQMKLDRDNEPVSDLDLLIHYKRLRNVFETLQSTLTCGICFETLGRGDPVTLACGHTYCFACCQHWAVRSSVNRYEATKGADFRPECPECRGDASRNSRVKNYMLEEAVRVLGRLDKVDLDALPPDEVEMHSQEVDEEAAAILRPRQRTRYAGAAS